LQKLKKPTIEKKKRRKGEKAFLREPTGVESKYRE